MLCNKVGVSKLPGINEKVIVTGTTQMMNLKVLARSGFLGDLDSRQQHDRPR